MYQTDKETVKLIVIACNTATAYGKEDIEDMLSAAGSEIKVIGVIDAGVRGALTSVKGPLHLSPLLNKFHLPAVGYSCSLNKSTCGSFLNRITGFISKNGFKLIEWNEIYEEDVFNL